MQTKEQLEDWWSKPDVWGFKTNRDDKERREQILKALAPHGPFNRALDIGCGEGFITADLPAKEIHGIELSDNAAKRLPKAVKRVARPEGKYDLVIATGALYTQYDWEHMREWIENHATGIVLTSHYDQMEAHDEFDQKKLIIQSFKYRDGMQNLKVYSWKQQSSTK